MGRNRDRMSLHSSWAAMIRRCTDESDPNYRHYGAKGIEVCDRWTNSFAAFCKDMGSKPSPRHSIDRFPYKMGDYEPGNCRWATAEQQANNKTSNVVIEHEGEKLTLTQWSKKTGLATCTIVRRMRKLRLPIEWCLAKGRFRSGPGRSAQNLIASGQVRLVPDKKEEQETHAR